MYLPRSLSVKKEQTLALQEPLFECGILPGHRQKYVERNYFELWSKVIQNPFDTLDVAPLPHMHQQEVRPPAVDRCELLQICHCIGFGPRGGEIVIV